MSLRLLGICAVMIGSSACASNPTVDGNWVRLGETTVTDRLEGDRIIVGAARGQFREIKLRVDRASVDFYDVIVHLGNGTREQVSIRRTINAGSETRNIDLGGRRTIRAVEFLYDANTLVGRQARVIILGKR